jgi:hypothetical protein
MKTISLLAILSVVLISCKEDEPVKPVPKTKTELLTNGSSKDWNITDEDPMDDDPLCRPSADYAKDNTWSFSSDGAFNFDRGSITANESCGDIINLFGSWQFTNNETRLVLTADQSIGDYQIFSDIIKLTEDSIVLEDDVARRVTFTQK